MTDSHARPQEHATADPMTDAEYLATGGNACPHCRSSEVAGGGVQTDSEGATQEVGCQACGATWLDTYSLSGWIAT